MQCIAPTLCRLVDRAGEYFVWDGLGWVHSGTVGADADPSGGPVSCPTATFCMLVVHDLWRSFNGRSWSPAHRLDRAGIVDLHDVDCATPTFCVAIRLHGPAYTWNGATWSGQEPTGAARALSVSCATEDFCVAVNAQGFAMHRVGGSWQPPREGDPVLGGRTRIACGDAHHCAMLDERGGYLAYNGSSWSAPQRIAAFPASSDVFLSSAGTFCAAAGPGGTLLMRRNGVWSAPHVLPSTAVVTGVSCGSPTLCVVTAERSITLWDGHSWTRRAEAGKDIVRGACGSDGCVLIVFDRTLEHRATRIYRPGRSDVTIDSRVITTRLSCTDVSFCMAVTSSGRRALVMFDGSGWADAPTATDFLPRSVSCASRTFCVGVDDQSEASWDGTQWSAPREIVERRVYLDDVSGRPGICVATGDGWAVIAR